MDLIVIAGTHMAGCTGLRRQILDAADAMRRSGIHVPSAYDTEARTWHNLAWDLGGDHRFDPDKGSLDQAVEEAHRTGARSLLLMSEEFESVAVDPEAVARLADLGRSARGQTIVVVAFRHQLSYLNLVFAFRAANGGHGTWFEDFVRAPIPGHQFDYVDVFARFDRHPDITTLAAALDDVVAGGGLEWILRRAGAEPPSLAASDLGVEVPPPAMKVLASLMAHRLVSKRQPWADRGEIRRKSRRVGNALSDRFGEAGPYWGWTAELIEERLPGFEAANEQLADVCGVRLTPDEPPADALNPHLREADHGVVRALLDELNAVTRLPQLDRA